MTGPVIPKPSKPPKKRLSLPPIPDALTSFKKDARDIAARSTKGLALTGGALTGKGCAGCSLSVKGEMRNNVAVITNRKKLLVIGSSVTAEDYQMRRLFAGSTGNIIREVIGETVLAAGAGAPVDWLNRNVAYTKAVRCRGNATVAEAHACWKHLETDIHRIDPDVILVAGHLAFSVIMAKTWADDVTNSTPYHGMTFPLLIAGRTRLVVTTVDPVDALKVLPQKFKNAAEEQSSEMFFFKDDIRVATQAVIDDIKVPDVDWKRYLFPFYDSYSPTVKQIREGVYVKGERLLMVEDAIQGFDVAREWVDRMLSTGVPGTNIGFDIETSGLKPYGGSVMLSYAISDGYYTVSVLVDHYSVRRQRDKVNKSLQLLKYFLLHKTDYVLCAHNLAFEMEWMFFYFGASVARKRRMYDDQSQFFACTMAAKWRIAAERHTRHMSLDAVTCQGLGFDLKAMYAIDREKMDLYQPRILLEYNAGDAIVVPYIIEEQIFTMEEILRNIEPYKVSIGGILSYSIMAGHGIPVNLDAANALAAPFLKELEELEKDIAETATYKSFAAAKGRPPVWQSPDDMAYILYDMFEMPKVYNKKTGQLSTDKHVISQYESQLPDLQLVVLYKEMRRFIDVTVSSLVHGKSAAGDIVTSPDGMIHPSVMIFKIPTDRTSTSPNIQNGSKRNKRFKKARDVYGISQNNAKFKNKTLILADSAQVDFRMAGLSCLDYQFINATRNDLDIHATMAQHWAALDPLSFARIAVYLGVPDTLYHDANPDNKKVLKEMRQRVKSGLVFARIYRAGLGTIARTLETTLSIAGKLVAILDGMFPRIATWHDDLQEFYRKHKCIRSITGNLLWGSLNFGDIFNYGIQSATAYVVKHAMRELTIKHGLQLVAEVHDELVFLADDSEVNDLIPVIGKAFCNIPDEWTKAVPLGCEVSVSDPQSYGNGWGSIKEVAKYSSKDFGWKETPIEDYEIFYRRQFEDIQRRPIYYIGSKSAYEKRYITNPNNPTDAGTILA